MDENVYTVSCISYDEYLFLISVFNFFPESDLSALKDEEDAPIMGDGEY